MFECLVFFRERFYTAILVTQDEGSCNLEKEVISRESIKFDFWLIIKYTPGTRASVCLSLKSFVFCHVLV